MRRFSLATSILLATILATGFAPIWALLANSLTEWVLPSSPRVPSIMVRQDGTPLLMHRDVASQSTLYTDLRGQPIDVNAEDPWLPWIELKPLSAGQPEDVSWNQRIRKFTDARSRPTLWYLISDGQLHGTAYFVGYDAASKYRIGFIAKDGFRESPPTATDCFPFAGGLRAVTVRVASLQNMPTDLFGWPTMGGYSTDRNDWQLYLLANDQRIYEIDLRERTVTVAYTAPHIEACALYSKTRKSPKLLIVRTDHQILVLNEEHKVERTYTISAEFATKSFRWAEVAPDQAIATWTGASLSIAGSDSEPYVWFNQAGHITRRETQFANGIDWHNVTTSLASPCLVVIGPLVFWLYPYVLLRDGATDRWFIAMQVSLEGFWPSLVFVTILSALLAAVCYRRLVRYGATPAERIAWPIFVFLGGLPAWVAYRFGRPWPVLDRCPECGAEVPRDRNVCAACRREFPLPERQGFEILTA